MTLQKNKGGKIYDPQGGIFNDPQGGKFYDHNNINNNNTNNNDKGDRASAVSLQQESKKLEVKNDLKIRVKK